ncbi:MAG: restriction endonuclease [Bacteroidales bacterium]|nr:restriction endonuclease [Bacteroidales bacterium]
MSLEKKIQELKQKNLEELNKREQELNNLQTRVNEMLVQAKKDFLAESQRIDEHIASEEERILMYKTRTEQEIERERERAKSRIDSHISDVLEYFEEMTNFGKDPKIIDAYINACYALDDKLAKYFINKPHPAPTTAETIRVYKKENIGYLQRIKDLEYQLSELWAKDTDSSEKEAFEYFDDDEERISYFLSASDYKNLSESERNQKALDNYLKRSHTKAHIGKMYERFIGYLYESRGYDVQYRGIEMGLKDGGIDLICRKNGEVILIQCKNWKLDSTIYEKHICQLYGASKFYDKDRLQEEYTPNLFTDIDWGAVKPVFVATTKLDEHAEEVALTLGVEVQNISFDKKYPIIKCNINNGAKIYHLPIDQMYDHTKICHPGECYVSTVKEAEALGFRRAYRWKGNSV